MTRRRSPRRSLRCSVPGCADEIAVCVGDDCRCLAHALQRANELRQAKGLPPAVLADDGSIHIPQ